MDQWDPLAQPEGRVVVGGVIVDVLHRVQNNGTHWLVALLDGGTFSLYAVGPLHALISLRAVHSWHPLQTLDATDAIVAVGTHFSWWSIGAVVAIRAHGALRATDPPFAARTNFPWRSIDTAGPRASNGARRARFSNLPGDVDAIVIEGTVQEQPFLQTAQALHRQTAAVLRACHNC